MSKFALKYPYFVLVVCLITCVIGLTSLARMPVDLFPNIKIPVVVVATFYSGMPPEQIENDITGRFERFFTLASGIDHMESRSLPGVSLIKIFFQPGTDPDAAVTGIANLASADLRRLPPGTLPPVVLKFDASSLPVCLITLKGEGLTQAQLRDQGQFNVRNQIAGVPGASVPTPFGGKYRQIMIYVDPLKLEAHQISVMDVVRTVNDANQILPVGDVRIGPFDYNLYSNSQIEKMSDLNKLPLKAVGNSLVMVGDVGHAVDGAQIQQNIVRVDGQRSVYLPIMKQGGNANTIAVVDGIKSAVSRLLDTPKALVTDVVFDQSVFVKNAVVNLIHEGVIGLALTGLMILIFLGSLRATTAVFLSIPLSVMATFIALFMGGGTVNTMVLGGLALALSRLIDNSVVVLENIHRHLELGTKPSMAAERGGGEVALPVLAATLTLIVVLFPVTLLYGVSQFLFSALALAVVLSLLASYVVAMTVVPLFCAKWLGGGHGGANGAPREKPSWGARFNVWFDKKFKALLDAYDRSLARTLARPLRTTLILLGVFLLSLGLFHFIGVSYFPRTDPGQFVINVKAPSGTRVELTEQYIKQVEDVVRAVVRPGDLKMIVANIGLTPDFSAMYTPNSGVHTAFVQVALTEDHKVGSYEYMDLTRARLAKELPQIGAYFQTGGLMDAILNLGLPAPIDIQVSGMNLENAHRTAAEIAKRVRALPGVSDVLIPQDVDYPALRLEVDRERAIQLGVTPKEVIDSVITALTSDLMIAPSFWVDPVSGNDYYLTVQYFEDQIKSLQDLEAIPLRSPGLRASTRLSSVASFRHTPSPTEVDHYQIRRVIDIYVAPSGEDLGTLAKLVEGEIKKTNLPEGLVVNLRGMVQGMRSSFRSFAIGLSLSVVLVFLILVAQFESFLDPFLILLAIPTGLTGVLMILFATGTPLNVMSLMGVLLMVGISVSDSILIVEFIRRLREDGKTLEEAVALGPRVRLRPVLMTTLATLIGLIPMAAKMGEGSETYAPLARAIIGGLAVSALQTVYLVPACYLMLHRWKDSRRSRPVHGGQTEAHA